MRCEVTGRKVCRLGCTVGAALIPEIPVVIRRILSNPSLHKLFDIQMSKRVGTLARGAAKISLPPLQHVETSRPDKRRKGKGRKEARSCGNMTFGTSFCQSCSVLSAGKTHVGYMTFYTSNVTSSIP